LLEEGRGLAVVRSRRPKQQNLAGRKINAVAAAIKVNPMQSLPGTTRCRSRQSDVRKRKIQSLHSRVVHFRSILTPTTLEKRAERAQLILSRMPYQEQGRS